MGLKSKPLNEVRSSIPTQDVIKEDSVRININVPDSLRQQWKIAAVKAKRPMTDLIIDAMSIYLSTDKHK